MARNKKSDIPAHIRTIYDRAEAGKKLTAAEHEVIQKWEAQQRAKAAGFAAPDDPGSWPVRTLEEDLEDWSLRDRVVAGFPRSFADVARHYGKTVEQAKAALAAVQREVLKRYGWEGAKRKGPLTGNEALAFQWAITLAQLARASSEWEMQMDRLTLARMNGEQVETETFNNLVLALSQMASKRDGLVTKVRELAVKEKREGGGGRTGPGKGNTFVIEMGRAPLVAPAAEPEKPKE